jgi:hypothetical protein
VRENSGVLADRLYQPADDDHRLAVDLDFNTLENPEAFERFLRANPRARRQGCDTNLRTAQGELKAGRH